MFKVINSFADSLDDGFVYQTGDTYPRDGYEPTPDRIIELIGTANGRGYPMIEKVDEAKAEAPVNEPEAEEEIPFSEPVTEEEAEATAEAETEETEEEAKEEATVEEPKPNPVRKTESKPPKAPAKKVGGRRKVTK